MCFYICLKCGVGVVCDLLNWALLEGKGSGLLWYCFYGILPLIRAVDDFRYAKAFSEFILYSYLCYLNALTPAHEDAYTCTHTHTCSLQTLIFKVPQQHYVLRCVCL